MKNLKFIAIALFATAAIHAQDLTESQVPESFTAGLLKAYPNATDIEWERSGNDYKVEFDVGRMEHEIWFNKDGDTVKIEKELTRSEIPSALLQVIGKDYPDYKIDSVESTLKNGVTTYEIELEKGWDEDLKVIFSQEGKVLSVKKD